MKEFFDMTCKDRALNVLILEENEEDAKLIMHQLYKLELPFQVESVGKKEGFINALKEFKPDIILSDYDLSSFNGMEALELTIKSYHPDVPFLFVSDTLGEELAVEAIKKGAYNLILKDNLDKLPRAIVFALREYAERTKRRQSERALIESEARYHQLLEQAPDPIIVINSETKIINVNAMACTEFGYTESEFLRLELSDIVPEKIHWQIDDIINTAATGVYFYEGYRKRKDNSVFPAEISATKQSNGDYQAIVRDISQRKKTEKALKEALRMLEFHVNNSPIGVIEFDELGLIKRWSSQAENIFGWTELEAIGKTPEDLQLVHPEDREDAAALFQSMAAGKVIRNINNSRNCTKEGTNIFCEWYSSVSLYESGRMQSLLSLVNDVTVNKLSEEARWEGQLEERKRVAREIHDGLGQMLIATKYKVASLSNSNGDLNAKVEEIEDLLERTIDEVRRTSKNLAPRSVEKLGIENAVRSLCEQTKKLTEINVSFHYIGENNKADNKILNTIYRIVQESLNNVVKYANASRVKVELNQSDKGVSLKVEDNGNGFNMEEVDFTQSNGINNIKERTNMLGGRFQINSHTKKGTRIIIFIPFVEFIS